MKNRSGWIFAILALLVVMTGAGFWIFLEHLHQLRTEVESTFVGRDELIKKFIALHSDQVHTMRNLVVEGYGREPGQEIPESAIAPHPDTGNWSLRDPGERHAGTLIGAGSLPLARGLRHEIAAALGTDPQIRAALDSNEEVAWLYYVSARDFIYLAPRQPFRAVQFGDGIYQRDYWRNSLPRANPSHRLILEGPYEDKGGKGWVMTFALPVYDTDNFLGVVALDLKVTTLEKLTNVGTALGETMMISENDKLIARQGGFVPDEYIHPPVSQKVIDWRVDSSGDFWLSSPVVADELWLVHRVSRKELLLTSARESITAWIVILLLGISVLMALRLRAALADITRMTYIDPLTQLLNRRGFHERVTAILEYAGRKHLPVAVLIMDIDFFKRINDTHGHGVGDEVLRQLGNFLNEARRPLDLACRWGGEEFVMVLLLEQAGQALSAAERLRQEAQRTRIPPNDEPVTLSGGLVLRNAGEPIDEAINRADALLYQAKAQGRNRIVEQSDS